VGDDDALADAEREPAAALDVDFDAGPARCLEHFCPDAVLRDAGGGDEAVFDDPGGPRSIALHLPQVGLKPGVRRGRHPAEDFFLYEQIEVDEGGAAQFIFDMRRHDFP
jgi:hypothetical protein